MTRTTRQAGTAAAPGTAPVRRPLTDVGPVEVKVPRDTAGTFEPQSVKGRQRTLTRVEERVPYLSFDVQIREVIRSGNMVESVNARIRTAVQARGRFPNEAAALECVCTAPMSQDPTGKGRRRWTVRGKAPLNAFQVAFQTAFEGRLTPPPATASPQPSSAVDWTHPRGGGLSVCSVSRLRSGRSPVSSWGPGRGRVRRGGRGRWRRGGQGCCVRC
nr:MULTISPECIES: transposase [unclassified Streptomyces]